MENKPLFLTKLVKELQDRKKKLEEEIKAYKISIEEIDKLIDYLEK